MGLEKVGKTIAQEIIAWTGTSGKSLLATKPVKVNMEGLKLAPQLGSDVVQIQSKKGLCHELWNRMFKDGNIYSAGSPTRVEYHSLLNSFNGMLNNTAPIKLKRPLPAFGNEFNPTVAEAIASTDIDFKALTPISENLTVYRCIGETPSKLSFKNSNLLFKKSSQIKPGDITVMREYAYCTPDKYYAEQFMNNDLTSIIYEISLPKGSRISQGTYDYGFRDYVLPRYSRFKCISNETLEDGSHKIKLEYILPDESWRKI